MPLQQPRHPPRPPHGSRTGVVSRAEGWAAGRCFPIQAAYSPGCKGTLYNFHYIRKIILLWLTRAGSSRPICGPQKPFSL